MSRGKREMQKVIAHVRRQEAESPSAEFSDPRQVGRELEPRGGAFEPRRSERDEPHREKHYRKKRKKGLWDLIEDILD